MADNYLTARAAIAAIIDAVAITTPVTSSIKKVHEVMPDAESVADFPCVILTGYQLRYLRGASGYRDRTYTIGLQLAVRPPGTAIQMRDVVDAFKDAISTAFDTKTKLGIPGGYQVLEGPNWISPEPHTDKGGIVWDDGEILISIKDAVSYAA